MTAWSVAVAVTLTRIPTQTVETGGPLTLRPAKFSSPSCETRCGARAQPDTAYRSCSGCCSASILSTREVLDVYEELTESYDNLLRAHFESLYEAVEAHRRQ